MHFEILVEDQSGKRMLDILTPKIIGDKHTFKVHAYQGIGRIPRNLTSGTDVRNRLLLNQLPRLLRQIAQFPLFSAEDSGIDLSVHLEKRNIEHEHY